jgi:predicted alpha/beta superfamily hydrolase
MKRYYLPLLIILFFYGCEKTDKSSSTREYDNQIVIGQIDSLNSDILGESRKVWVHMPINFQEDKKYPVLYLLDGPGHFYSVAGIIKQMSNTALVPEMIVVAIPNTDRNRDLTPTKVVMDFWSGDSIQYESGGGDLFLDFIEKELIPYIDKTYPTAPYRTYVGHSFGGLSVINALVNRTDLFNAYVAIDPSLWWDNMAYLNYADSILSAGDFTNKRLFVGVANTMDEGMGIDMVEKDTTKNSAHIRSILKFVKSQDSNNNGLEFDWKYYEDENHGTVPLITEYDAFRFLFSWYRFKEVNKLYDTSLSIDESMELVRSHYERVSTYMGYDILPEEGLINSIGYFFISEKKFDKAAAFLDLNIQNHPNSNNVYDSRGDCYLAAGDSLKALEFFKKALEVGDNDFSQKKIDALTKNLAE